MHRSAVIVMLALGLGCKPQSGDSSQAPEASSPATPSESEVVLKRQIVCRAMQEAMVAEEIKGRRPLLIVGARELGRADVPAQPCDSSVAAGLRLATMTYLKPWAAESFEERGVDGVIRVELAEAEDVTDQRE